MGIIYVNIKLTPADQNFRILKNSLSSYNIEFSIPRRSDNDKFH